MNDSPPFVIGAINRPIAGEDCCGDAYACWQQEQRLFLSLADGLGHGALAREAALAALASVQRQPADATLPEIIARCDEDLRATRGAALGIAVVDPLAQTISFCGVGNIRAVLLHPLHYRRFTCGYGIVGAGFKNLYVDTQPFHPEDALVMASDGILEHFVVAEDFLAAHRTAQNLADVILRDWSVDTDDAAVLVYRATP